ncbi:MAG: hypothetical protein AB7Q04_13450 [Steroidobacteraceae bacterium]
MSHIIRNEDMPITHLKIAELKHSNPKSSGYRYFITHEHTRLRAYFKTLSDARDAIEHNPSGYRIITEADLEEAVKENGFKRRYGGWQDLMQNLELVEPQDQCHKALLTKVKKGVSE